MKMIRIWFCLMTIVTFSIQAQVKESLLSPIEGCVSEKRVITSLKELLRQSIQGNSDIQTSMIKEQISKSGIRAAEYRNPIIFESSLNQDHKTDYSTSYSSNTKTNIFSGTLSKTDDLGIIYSTTISTRAEEETLSSSSQTESVTTNAIRLDIEVPIFQD
jgi:hypothetical protein